MPEGPEIRREADRVGRAIVGKRAEEVWFFHDRLKPFEHHLSGQVVSSVTSRGKALLTAFENDFVIVSHNQLYGRWMTRKGDKLPETNRSLRLSIRNETHAALLYSASEIDVYERDALDSHPYLAKLGPDALDEAVTAKQVRERLESPTYRRRRLAALFLDQGFLAGIGNYLRSELLFVARVDPARRPIDCTRRELAAVARAALQLTRQSYRTAGITNDAATVKRLKAAGATRARYRYRVFGRDGRSCYRCGGTIERDAQAGRRIYVCRTCQIS
ncbi:MAG: endonuclease VIII [Planctomycetota bacterium]